MFKEALSDDDIKEIFGAKKEPKTSMKNLAETGSECRKNQMTDRGSPQISEGNMNFVNTQKNKIIQLDESRAKVQKALEVRLQKERDRSEKVESSQLSTDQAVKRERIALLYRSGWNQIGGQTQYILKADNPAFSAGPRSGEIKPAAQFNPHSTSYEQHGTSYNFMQFPVVQGHNNESIQSKRQNELAASATRPSKYKSRNSILNSNANPLPGEIRRLPFHGKEGASQMAQQKMAPPSHYQSEMVARIEELRSRPSKQQADPQFHQ